MLRAFTKERLKILLAWIFGLKGMPIHTLAHILFIGLLLNLLILILEWIGNIRSC